MEIDGLSPISSNINPNFRASYDYDDEGVEYEEAEGDENGAFMNDKSHTNIASFPNLHNNSSSNSKKDYTFKLIFGWLFLLILSLSLCERLLWS